MEGYKIDIYKNSTDNSARFILGCNGKNPLIVLGVNPSTADENKPDATIRRVIGYAKRNGFDGFIMINLYPLRKTIPAELPNERNVELNNVNIQCITSIVEKVDNPTILVAFGNTITIRPYLIDCLADIINALSDYPIAWKQIGSLTKLGYPRHPSRGVYQSLEDCDLRLMFK